MRDIVYDKIIPLGDRCNCTQNLKHYNLRPIGRKYPFDWVKRGTFVGRIKIILGDFDDFLVAERLCQVVYDQIEKWHNYRFWDPKTKLVFAHDFPKDLPFVEGFRVAQETYAPKIKRFKEVFENKEKVLLVYMTDKHVTNKDARTAISKLRKKFGYDDIDLLIIENGIRTIWRIKRQKVAPGITRIKTRRFLMPTHYTSTSPRQFKILDKIFKKIRVKEDNNEYCE